MLALELFEELEGPPEPTLIDALRDFLPIAVDHLKLKAIPKITFVKDVKNSHVPTFGRFTNESKRLFVDIENRHPNDIIRTLAHELTHFAQGEANQLSGKSWETGSPVENDANAQAGVMMRKFNTKFPQYLKMDPVILPEGWSKKYKDSINCSNPKGFSQKAHCAGKKKHTNEAEESDPTKPIPFPKGTTLVNVSDVYDWYKLGMAVPALDKADPRIFNKGVPHTVFAFGSEEEEHRMIPLLKRLGFSLHDIDNQDDYEKAIRASDVVEHLEQYVAENLSEGEHCDAKNAVPELKAALTKRKTELKNASAKSAYDKIDKIMTRIAQTYNISGQELHDLWTERYGEIPDTWVLDENFADGKGPGRPGDSQRHGIPKGATMAQLEKAAKAPGRKGQLARWQINMRRGKKK